MMWRKMSSLGRSLMGLTGQTPNSHFYLSCSVTLQLLQRRTLTSRKHILPVLKAIHPDLFAQRDKDVQQDNLQCVQVLNELWDSLNKLEAAMEDGNSSSPTVAVNIPFRSSYNLKCHVEVEDLSLRVVHVKIDTPSHLCTRQMIPRSIATKNITTLYHFMSLFFKDLKIDIPREWDNIVGTKKSGGDGVGGDYSNDSNSNSNRPERNEDFLKFLERDDIQSLIVDNIVKNSSMSDQNPLLYKNQHTRQSYGQSLALKEKFNQLAMKFVNGGHVKFKAIDTDRESEAITKLIDFFAEYGPYINFRSDNWRDVFIVVHDLSNVQSDGPLKELCDNGRVQFKSRFDKFKEASNRKERQQLAEFNSQYGYNVVENMHIVVAPVGFKTSSFLSFLLTVVPQASNMKDLALDQV